MSVYYLFIRIESPLDVLKSEMPSVRSNTPQQLLGMHRLQNKGPLQLNNLYNKFLEITHKHAGNSL